MISVIVYIPKEEFSYVDTLRSAYNQTFKDKEIIAICDACSIETLQKVKGITDKVIAFKNYKGGAIAKNEAAQRAQGDVLVFVDSGVNLSPEVLSDIYNTKDKWVVGTCVAEAPDEEAEYSPVYAFKNKRLLPRGDHNLVVFCKKLTFEVLGKFNGGVVDETKDLIKRFKEKGEFFILQSPVYPVPKEFIGKTAFSAKLTAMKNFFKSNKVKKTYNEVED